jgi:threonine dehydratase
VDRGQNLLIHRRAGRPRAAQTADPVFRNSPQLVSEQLCTALGRNVLVKIQTANPLGSF